MTAIAGPITPDFAAHWWDPLSSVEFRSPTVVVRWPDGMSLEAHSVWLYEATRAIDPLTREATVDPGELPEPDFLLAAELGNGGTLALTWVDGMATQVHPGWLRYVADGDHLPDAAIGEPVTWTADQPEPPTFDGRDGPPDEVFEAWLEALCTRGIARLRGAPATDEYLGEFGRRIGPIRGSNFGGVFTVEAILEPDSTANTGASLGQHTDLPTRETPPGFQFLHCVANTVAGGDSRMTDGLAVIDVLRREHPGHYEALTTLEWVFANRALDGDHRWIGPIIDHGAARSPVTLRAFYPVRLAPHMDPADVPRAYEAMRTFSRVAHDPRLMIRYPFVPGDLVGFDNRRVLHGRDAFDPGGGTRRLRGCYLDRDDVFSRLRVLRRPGSREASP
ncbi:MAG: TauD/TfdA family dioxygenase [Ilumatobacteraceae bacterium]